MLQRIRSEIRGFFEGKPIGYDPANPLLFLNHTVRHPLATFLLGCRDFWLRHWKWLIGAAIAIASLIMARR